MSHKYAGTGEALSSRAMSSSPLLFWLLALLLLVLPLALVIPALWRRRPPQGALRAGGANVAVYRDQLREAERDLAADLVTPERYAQTRAEIQRRVLEDAGAAEPAAAHAGGGSRAAAWLLLLLIPLASVATYLALGSPQAMLAAGTAPSANQAASVEQVETMLASLAQRLKDKPDDPRGWAMLGRSYLVMERFDDAAAALRKGLAIEPANADMLTDLADATARLNDRKLAGEPAQLLARALAADPQHAKALALAGSAAFEVRDYAKAREHWRKLLERVPEGSELAQSINTGIQQAETLMAMASAPAGAARDPHAALAASPGAQPSTSTAPPAAAAPAAAAGKSLAGRVELSPALASRIAPGDTLFVFARAAEGPRAPLAIIRKTAADLPIAFSLDDSMAMTPALRLSAFDKVVVVARISKSGQTAAQSGDLIGQSAPVAPGAAGLRVVIDGVQP